jgi:hypothetical protein
MTEPVEWDFPATMRARRRPRVEPPTIPRRRRSISETPIVLAALIVAIGIFPVVPFLVIVIAFYQLATGQ